MLMNFVEKIKSLASSIQKTWEESPVGLIILLALFAGFIVLIIFIFDWLLVIALLVCFIYEKWSNRAKNLEPPQSLVSMNPQAALMDVYAVMVDVLNDLKPHLAIESINNWRRLLVQPSIFYIKGVPAFRCRAKRMVGQPLVTPDEKLELWAMLQDTLKQQNFPIYCMNLSATEYHLTFSLVIADTADIQAMCEKRLEKTFNPTPPSTHEKL